MKKLLSLLFFKLRLALLAGIGRFVILPIFKALFSAIVRRLARQADTVRRAQAEAEPAFAPAYARAYARASSAPRQPVTLNGECRRIDPAGDRRQNW